jgi:ssRNA-specific RNase YbeY (16S rRNA maturation enzyme)
MVHGVLHLLGYKDKTDKEKITMRALEDSWLTSLNNTLSDA